MIYPLYRKLPLIPTRAAMNELFDNNLDLYTVLDILENGYDCPKSKREKEPSKDAWMKNEKLSG